MQAEWSDEGCLLTISWLHLHLPVATCKVNGWKPLRPWQGIRCVFNTWERVGVLFCDTVDSVAQNIGSSQVATVERDNIGIVKQQCFQGTTFCFRKPLCNSLFCFFTIWDWGYGSASSRAADSRMMLNGCNTPSFSSRYTVTGALEGWSTLARVFPPLQNEQIEQSIHPTLHKPHFSFQYPLKLTNSSGSAQLYWRPGTMVVSAQETWQILVQRSWTGVAQSSLL